MPHKIGIYYDQSGLDDIMIGHKMEEMERSIMLQKKSEIEAAFFCRHSACQGISNLK